jgi:hypothetical protein
MSFFATFWSWLTGKGRKSSTLQLEDGSDFITETGATLDLEK